MPQANPATLFLPLKVAAGSRSMRDRFRLLTYQIDRAELDHDPRAAAPAQGRKGAHYPEREPALPFASRCSASILERPQACAANTSQFDGPLSKSVNQAQVDDHQNLLARY